MSREFMAGVLAGFVVTTIAIPLLFNVILPAIGPWITPTEYRAYRKWRGGKWLRMCREDPYWVAVPNAWNTPDEDWN